MNNILIKGAPGTGKTICSRAMAYYVCDKGESPEDTFTHDISVNYGNIEQFIAADRVEFIQIHPSITYEDIVFGIDVKAKGPLSVSYAEKRIKSLCDRAIGKQEKYCVILDDITRTNTGALLGNLLYAMEYRGEAVELADGNTLIVPENVVIIITSCELPNSESLEYALRRRFDYCKELTPDRSILAKYYSALPRNIQDIILNAFDSTADFVKGNILSDPSIRKECYIPGHELFLADRNGTFKDVLQKVKLKIKYQVIPYIVELKKAVPIADGFLVLFCIFLIGKASRRAQFNAEDCE